MPYTVLVSACLLGQPVRYDGGAKPIVSPILDRWRDEGRVVPLCPEVLGGLPVPRPPVERQADGRFRDCEGRDRTAAFDAGAAASLALASGAALALLKEGSPSCGVRRIYDGTFTGQSIPGEGRTAEALRRAGIPVFGEDDQEAAAAWLARLEAGGPFALWLLPAEEDAGPLAATIATLSVRTGVGPFPPHVTLASGALAPDEHPGPRLARAALSHGPLTLEVTGLDRRPAYFRRLALGLEASPALAALASTLRRQGAPPFEPHLSLAYGQAALPLELGVEAPSRLHFDRLALAFPPGPDWRDVAGWRVALSVELQARTAP